MASVEAPLGDLVAFSEPKGVQKGWQNEVRKDPKELKKRILNKIRKRLFRYSIYYVVAMSSIPKKNTFDLGVGA